MFTTPGGNPAYNKQPICVQNSVQQAQQTSPRSLYRHLAATELTGAVCEFLDFRPMWCPFIDVCYVALPVLHCIYLDHRSRFCPTAWSNNHLRSTLKEHNTFDTSHASSYCYTTMAIYCIISEIKWNIGQKSWPFHIHLHFLSQRTPLEHCCVTVHHQSSRIVAFLQAVMRPKFSGPRPGVPQLHGAKCG